MSLYCRPTDVLAPTWSLAVGAAVADNPVTQLGMVHPWSPRPFKGTSGTITARATFGGATEVQAAFILGHNLHGVTVALSSGAGLSASLVLSAATPAGFWVNGWKDYRTLSGRTSTTFDFAISGASANVQINKILLIGTVRRFGIVWGFTEGLRIKSDSLRTALDSPLTYETGVRGRPLKGQVRRGADRADILALMDAARGVSRGWWLSLDETEGDALFARFTEDTVSVLREYQSLSPVDILVEEFGLGRVLT